MQSTAASNTEQFGGTSFNFEQPYRFTSGIRTPQIERLRDSKFSGWNPSKSIDSALGIKPSISWGQSIYYVNNDLLAYQILDDLLKNHKQIVQLAYANTGFNLDNPHRIIIEVIDLAMEKWIKEIDNIGINLDYINSPIVKLSCFKSIGYHISFGTFIYPFDPVIFEVPTKPKTRRINHKYEFDRNIIKGIADAFGLDENDEEDYEEDYEYDLSPTGHGDICMPDLS